MKKIIATAAMLISVSASAGQIDGATFSLLWAGELAGTQSIVGNQINFENLGMEQSVSGDWSDRINGTEHYDTTLVNVKLDNLTIQAATDYVITKITWGGYAEMQVFDHASVSGSVFMLINEVDGASPSEVAAKAYADNEYKDVAYDTALTYLVFDTPITSFSTYLDAGIGANLEWPDRVGLSTEPGPDDYYSFAHILMDRVYLIVETQYIGTSTPGEVSTVPESDVYGLFLVGLGFMALTARKRKKSSS